MSKPEALVQYFNALPEKTQHDIRNKMFINRVMERDFKPELKTKIILTYMVNDRLRGPQEPAADWAAYGTAHDFNAALPDVIRNASGMGEDAYIDPEALKQVQVPEETPKSDLAAYTPESTSMYYRGPATYTPTGVGDKLVESVLSDSLPDPNNWSDWLDKKYKDITQSTRQINTEKAEEPVASISRFKHRNGKYNKGAHHTEEYDKRMASLFKAREAYWKRNNGEELSEKEAQLADAYERKYLKAAKEYTNILTKAVQRITPKLDSRSEDVRKKANQDIDFLTKQALEQDKNYYFDRGVQAHMEHALNATLINAHLYDALDELEQAKAAYNKSLAGAVTPEEAQLADKYEEMYLDAATSLTDADPEKEVTDDDIDAAITSRVVDDVKQKYGRHYNVNKKGAEAKRLEAAIRNGLKLGTISPVAASEEAMQAAKDMSASLGDNISRLETMQLDENGKRIKPEFDKYGFRIIKDE